MASYRRFEGVKRDYSPEDVEKLKGTFSPDCNIARFGAERLWTLVQRGGGSYVQAMGAMTGGQAVQMAKAGLSAIYCSGWQVAGDNNSALQTFPDQSLYPADSCPKLVQRINNALMRADQIAHMEGNKAIDYRLPIVADAEAGFGGALNAFELTKNMIIAGAAGVHFEDQLASEKKCGHMGGKVLVPTKQFIKTLNAARLAADTLNVPTVIIARTDANAATMVTSDIDPRDKPFLTGKRSPEGFFYSNAGLDQAIARALSYAPYCDMLWCETARPNIHEARRFAEAVHAKFPGKPLAYNCSPSFNWRAYLSEKECFEFQREIAKFGYRFQFITLAGFHSLNFGMFKLAKEYIKRGMAGYADLQQEEFKMESEGFTAHKHQREVGTGYFDKVSVAVAGGTSSLTALTGSTEEQQFKSKL